MRRHDQAAVEIGIVVPEPRIAKEALGDLNGTLTDINQAIRLDPTLPQPLINGSAIWCARGDLDRAIADGSEPSG
ncbi:MULTISPECIES: hypothetical protein [unclassified Bradyrhizobium]|uniref:hypothetical protein n=1 Tax=unclassified Bradyrhizobium TaxID=2631580 RepID=UPI0033968A42